MNRLSLRNKRILTIVCLFIIPVIIISAFCFSNNKEAVTSNTLSNRNADETTKAVYAYLASLQGNQVLSAQQKSTWMSSGGAKAEAKTSSGFGRRCTTDTQMTGT